MNLLCCESTPVLETLKRAYPDPTLLNDERVLANLLKTEEQYNLSIVQFPSVQYEVKPEMRKVVAEWMWEVCEDQKCQDDVFVLAVNLMDRFLTVCGIRKNQLQLLSTACMLLASKLREPVPLSGKALVYYTDNSINADDLWTWELLVLSKLKWDIAAITPQDFLCHILRRLPVESVGIDQAMIESHSKTLIALCAREFAFSQYPASMIACASVASALCGLGWLCKSGHTLSQLINKLHNITSIEEDYLMDCLKQIENMVRSASNPYSDEEDTFTEEMPTASDPRRPDEFTPPPTEVDKLHHHGNTGTPTDIRDIDF